MRMPNVELTGARRRDALARLQTMYRVPAAGPRWPAVARPVERVVRLHFERGLCATAYRWVSGTWWTAPST
jgi:hypothetical protein